jgi:hypothetical protein
MLEISDLASIELISGFHVPGRLGHGEHKLILGLNRRGEGADRRSSKKCGGSCPPHRSKEQG